MKKVIWLASYPKSGNTWMRAFLCSLLYKKENNIIENLPIPNSSSREILDENLDIETSDLTVQETELLRPIAMRSFAKDILQPHFFFKVHDFYSYLPNGQALFPSDISIGAVYIVRNPLDVAVSFSYHFACDIDFVIRLMNNPNASMGSSNTTFNRQVTQKLSNWSNHYKSWNKQSDIPVLLVKYEDLRQNPEQNFREMLNFCGIHFTEADLHKAIISTSFNQLRSMEQKYGFNERPIGVRSFFREGKVGGWRNKLSEEQANTIISNQYDVMMELGYIDKNGQLLV